MNLAIIPARGGSTRIPRKNMKLFHGKPIIQYSIEAAIATGLFDEIYVSTDDMDIQGVALECGAKTIRRPDELAVNEVGTYEVIRDAAKRVGGADYVCGIYATAPLMRSEDIRFGLGLTKELDTSHSISVGYPPLQDAAQFYWSKMTALEKHIPYFSSTTRLVPISQERICDINTYDDWRRAEEMYLKLGEINGR